MDVDDRMKLVSQRLKNARKTAGMTQLELSLQSGVSQNMITYIEQGKRGPTLRTVLKLCEALGISISDLIDSDSSQAVDREAVKAEIRELLEKL